MSHPLHPLMNPQSLLYVCVSIAALQIGSSVPSFQIPYICINIWYLSFPLWLLLLCIIGSRFIHLIRPESNVFLFMAEYYSTVYMYHNFFIQKYSTPMGFSFSVCEMNLYQGRPQKGDKRIKWNKMAKLLHKECRWQVLNKLSAVVTYKSNFCNVPAFYSHIIKPISVHMHCPLWGLRHKAQYPPGRKRMYNVEQNFSTLAPLMFGLGHSLL